jgi:hypothetical protein
VEVTVTNFKKGDRVYVSWLEEHATVFKPRLDSNGVPLIDVCPDSQPNDLFVCREFELLPPIERKDDHA